MKWLQGQTSQEGINNLTPREIQASRQQCRKKCVVQPCRKPVVTKSTSQWSGNFCISKTHTSGSYPCGLAPVLDKLQDLMLISHHVHDHLLLARAFKKSLRVLEHSSALLLLRVHSARYMPAARIAKSVSGIRSPSIFCLLYIPSSPCCVCATASCDL